MASEEANETAEAPSGKGGPGLLVMLIVMLLSLAAGAGAAYFVLDQRDQSNGSSEEATTEDGEPKAPESYQDRLLSLEPFVVNVGGDSYARFLKLKVELEADSMATRDELESRRPQVRDTIILLLSSKRLADVAEFEGKALLKDDIGQRINRLLPEGRVESILFTEFVVQ